MGKGSPITELKIPVKLGLCKACKQLFSDGEDRTDRKEKEKVEEKEKEKEDEKVPKVDLSRRRAVSSAPPTPVSSRPRLDLSDPLKLRSVSKTSPTEAKYVPSFALDNAVRRMAGTKDSYLRELGR